MFIILHVEINQVQGGQTLLPIDEFVTAVVSTFDHDGLQAKSFVAASIDILEQLLHLRLVPAVAALISGDRKRSLDIPNVLRIQCNVPRIHRNVL